MNTPSDDDRIRQHADLVYRTCLRITGNAQDAADVAQEVFVAWLCQHREIRGSVAAWLYGTARQRSLDFLRANHRRDRHEQQAAMPFSADAHEDDWRTHLDDALNELPVTARTLVVEHHLLGLTQGQLAARYRCTQATISRRLTQTLDLLRAALRSRGVTVSSAALLAGFTAAPATTCPAPLVAPVLAQAQVAGTPVLVGPMLVAGWNWWLWSGIAAAGLTVMLTMGVVGVRWWAEQTVNNLEADWQAIATAGLPVVATTPVVPKAGERYPSIEELIARLPPVDPTIQDALRALSHANAAPSQQVLGDWSITSALGTRIQVIDEASGWWHRRPATVEEQAILVEMRAGMAPLLAILRRGDASLSLGGWLEEEYRAGRLASLEQRGVFCASGSLTLLLAREMTTVLCVEAMAAAEPQVALADLDLLCRALERSGFSFIDVLVASTIQTQRDGLYLRLHQQGTLSARDRSRWQSEHCVAQESMGMAFLGEFLSGTLPMLQDYRARRLWESEVDLFDVRHRLGEVEMVRFVRWASDLQPLVRASLHGDGAALFRRHDQQAHATVIGSISWGNLALTLATVAERVAHHRAVRAAATLIDAVRMGQTLPEHLPVLAGEKPDAWAMRYERLSPTRFRFHVDPTLVQPAYCLQGTAQHVSARLTQATSSVDRVEVVIDSPVLIEVETIPLPAVIVPAPIPALVAPPDEEPPIPTVAQ